MLFAVVEVNCVKFALLATTMSCSEVNGVLEHNAGDNQWSFRHNFHSTVSLIADFSF